MFFGQPKAEFSEAPCKCLPSFSWMASERWQWSCLLSSTQQAIKPEPQRNLCEPLMPVPQGTTQHTRLVPSTDIYISFIPKPARFSFYFWLTLHHRAIKTCSDKALAGYPKLNHLNAHLQLTAFYCCCLWNMASFDENKQILGKNYSRKSWIFMACTQKPDWQVNASGRDKRSDGRVTFIYAVYI